MTALYAVLFVLAPIASGKIASLGPFTFPAGFLVMAVAFAVLDLVNERDGKRAARSAIMAALLSRAFVYFVIFPVLLSLPGKVLVEGYDALLNQAFRLFLWGEIAMLVSQWFVDVPLFAWIRDRLDRRWFVLRYLGSTLASMTIGALIFVVGGYFGTGLDPLALFAGSIVARLAMTLILAPVVWVAREVYVGD